jgi:hypothetical protein
MTLVQIGSFTINPDAIDYIGGERQDYCEAFFRNGKMLPFYLSKAEVDLKPNPG